MNILIDARLYGLEHAGIGRYVKELVDNLFTLDKNNKYTLILNSKYSDKLKCPLNFSVITSNSGHYTLREQYEISRIIKNAKPDLVHFPHFNTPLVNNVPFVVTIHDMLWHNFKGRAVTSQPPLTYYLKYAGYRVVFANSVKKSKKIIVPSQTIKSQLVKSFSLPPKKITVTYEGIGSDYLLDPVDSSQVKTPKQYVCYTGSVYPHKNIPILLKAIKLYNLEIKKEKLHLIISTARNVFLDRLKDEISDLQLNDYVHIYTHPTDKQLKYLYKNAVAYVFPSLSEGFGLPGLEAMASSVPVLASDIPVFREIYSKNALYFNPNDPDSLLTQIKAVLKFSRNQRSQVTKRAKSYAKKFSWQEMVKQTIEIYQGGSHRL